MKMKRRPSPAKRKQKEVERLSNLTGEMNEPIDPRMKQKFKDNPEDRFGEYRVSEAKKGGYLKDIMGDKKGKVIYKGKAKDYKMIIPIEPPKPKPSKKMSGGMVKVKTRLGKTKPTKIY